MSHHSIMTTYFLLVIHSPVTLEVCKPKKQRVRENKNAHFVVITSPQINHDVLVPEVRRVTNQVFRAGRDEPLTGRRT